MAYRILFVDDEPNVRQGLRRLLRSMREGWDMAFAESGPEALDIMQRQPFDVVVTDMRMPGMDGAELLRHVMDRYPQTIRIILSGQAEKHSLLQSFGLAHQFLAKPCDSETLKTTVARAFSLHGLLENRSLKNIVSKMTRLPSLPQLYRRVMEELQSNDASVRKIALLIESDLAMSAKILQVVNSPYFGLCSQVTSPAHAVTLLGLDTIRSIVLVVHAFSEFPAEELNRKMPYDALWAHSMRVGAYARAIASRVTRDRRIMEESYTAGLLHDIGKLLLAANHIEDYVEVLELIDEEGMSFAHAEAEIFGATHAEVGAYLIGIWGLSDSLIAATAFHHVPSRARHTQFTPLAAVHAANVFIHEQTRFYGNQARPLLDMAYFTNLGLEEGIGSWRECCLESLEPENTNER